VIAAGFVVVRGGPTSLLGTGLFRWVGSLSYSIYLWHWPLIVAATAYWNGLTAGRGLAVAAVSIVPAWLTHRLVENPLRYSKAVSRSPRLALSMGANFTLVGVVAGLVLLLTLANAAAPAPASAQARGAAVLAADPRDDPAGAAPDRVDFITPDPLKAVDDLPSYAKGCHPGEVTDEPISCRYGNPRSETKVVVAGDSKIAQWLPALELLAVRNDWNMVVYTKSSCAFAAATTPRDGRPDQQCAAWNRALLDKLTSEERPDYVITSQVTPVAITAGGELSADAMVEGMRTTWKALTAAGSKVIVVADTPNPGMKVYECVDEHRDDVSACTYPRDQRPRYGAYTTQVRAVDGQDGVTIVDLFDAICPTEQCSPVIGNVLIYRQGSHVTATYVRTLTPRLAAAFTGVGLPTTFDGAGR
jgi:hypothetical protein